MREIKYRVWDKKENKWYEPVHEAYAGKLHSLMLSPSGEFLAHTMEGVIHESKFPKRYVAVQYTGLKDKNGKKIYEGDFVQSWNNLFRVDWVEEKLGFVFVFIKKTKVKDELMNDNKEVMDNIYENPELL